MANRFCIQCGTLLPEDGVCLRCGAVYSFADDGTLTIHPRKVKKISAKATPKKKVFAKRTIDSHEADTQTIPIPEDIFSHSEQDGAEEKHADWTGSDAGDVSFQSEGHNEYNPNFVLQDEEEAYEPYPDHEDSQTYYDLGPSIAEEPEKASKRTVSRGVLWFLFLVIAVLSAILAYQVLNSWKSVDDTAGTQMVGSSTSITARKESTTKKATPVFTATALRVEAAMIGDDSVIYSLDKASGRLDIYYSGNCPMGMILLPLVDGPDLAKKHLSLAVLAKGSKWSFDELLCESDLIKEGIIKEIKLHIKNDETTSEASYQFSVESGRLEKIYHVDDYADYYGMRNSDFSEVDYSYDSQGRVTTIKKTDDNDDSFVEMRFKYDSNGYLSEVYRKESYPEYSEETTDTLKYSEKQLLSITPKGEFKENRTVASFEYDENGTLKQMRKRSYDKFENEEYVFSCSPLGEINTVRVDGIEEGDTYTYSRG